MTIESIPVQAFRLTPDKEDQHLHLDPVNVFFQDLCPGAGRVIIECYGRVWTAFFNSMGRLGVGSENEHSTTICEFVKAVSTDYLVNVLAGHGPRMNPRDRAYLGRIVQFIQQALSQPSSSPPYEHAPSHREDSSPP